MTTITIKKETREELESLMDKEIYKQLKESKNPNNLLLKMSQRQNKLGISYDDMMKALIKVYKKNR